MLNFCFCFNRVTTKKATTTTTTRVTRPNMEITGHTVTPNTTGTKVVIITRTPIMMEVTTGELEVVSTDMDIVVVMDMVSSISSMADTVTVMEGTEVLEQFMGIRDKALVTGMAIIK